MRSNDTPRLLNRLYDEKLLMNSYTGDCCGKLSIAWLGARSDSSPSNVYQVAERLHELNGQLSWWPLVGVGKEYEDVPEHIAAAASEAQKCLSIGAYRAAVSLARAVVEATAKAQGIMTGTLEVKINTLHDRGLIRLDIRDAAHEVRHLGNEMAHGDFVSPVDEEEATETLGLMEEVLDEVFQSPARTARRKAARVARKNEKATERPAQ
ncbi:DUF4145 domain-containing protein [Saccharopolyspora cebuensis]|uniref:DUF4145 domain-containing protein n=1 Tax=Saccharopolyspora cebuensis TaxID=418759 RepID=A0ABV4CGS9_9PSEU